MQSFIVLVLVILVSSELGNARLGHPRAKCFAQWDSYMAELHRQRRDTNMEWQDTVNYHSCSLTDTTTHDALQRRSLNRLVPIEHQGYCGSCTAFALSHTYADTLNLMNEHLNPSGPLSADFLTKCIRPGGIGNGCCGISFQEATAFLQNNGAVTNSCIPYTLRTT